MGLIGGNMPVPVQFRRESAQICAGLSLHFAGLPNCASIKGVQGDTHQSLRTVCHYLYPSPNRSGPCWIRPVPHRSTAGRKSANMRDAFVFSVVSTGRTRESVANQKSNKGRPSCVNSTGYLQPSQSAGSQPVSIPTLSGALQAPQQARLRPMRLGAMRSPGHLSAVPQASHVTTSAPKPVNNTSRPSGRLNHWNRRGGLIASTAVLHSKDQSDVQ